MSAYDPRLILESSFRPAPSKLLLAQDINAARQKREIELAEANAATRQSDQTYAYNEAVHPAMVTQQAEAAKQAQMRTQGDALGIPEKQLQAKQAGVEGNYLDQMFPGAGQAPQVPPPMSGAMPMSRESDVQQVPPPIANQFQDKSLSELMQMKATAGPSGEFLGKFIDPLIQRKILTEKQAMYDDLNSPTWQEKINKIGIKNTNGSNAFNEFRKTHPIIEMLPETEQAKIQTESFKANAQPNMAGLMAGAQVMSPDVLNSIIDQVHSRNMAPQDALDKARLLGFNGVNAEMQIVKGLKDKYGEDFDLTSAARGKKMATNNGVSNYVAAMDNAYSTAQHMKDVLKNLHNTDSKTANNAIQAFKREFNNLDQLRADVVQTTAQEEFGPAVARGSGTVTDKARGIVDKMTPINLNDAGTKATIDEVLQSISRNRKAIEDASYGYIKPRKTIAAAPKGVNPNSVQPIKGASGPLSKPEAHWYLDQANGDIEAAKAAAQRDGRTF